MIVLMNYVDSYFATSNGKDVCTVDGIWNASWSRGSLKHEIKNNVHHLASFAQSGQRLGLACLHAPC